MRKRRARISTRSPAIPIHRASPPPPALPQRRQKRPPRHTEAWIGGRSALALLVALALMHGGCASRVVKSDPALAGLGGMIGTGAAERSVLRVEKGGALLPTSEMTLWEAAGKAQVVYVGEEHDSARMHRFEQAVLSRLASMDPSLGLGLEMLPVTMQQPLDDFVAGLTSEAAFLKAVDWEKTWGYPWEDYRPLLLACRTQHLKAYALNAPRALSHAVAQAGVSGLSDADRKQLPEMVPGPAAHRAQFDVAMANTEGARGHGGPATGASGNGTLSSAALEHYYEAQLLWDETMAQTVARVMAGSDAPRHLLVVAGMAHMRRFAVPERARRRGVKTDLVLLPVDAEEADVAAAAGADFLWPLDPTPRPKPLPAPVQAMR